LKQGQYSPFSLERMVVSIWAGTTGQLDDVPLVDIRRFESEFLDFIARERKAIFDVIAESKELSDDTVAKMTDAITAFKKQFAATGAAKVNEAEVAAEGPDAQEQITRFKK
jgi:F-type H+-transporting ATPase subunit alpha